jgi:hypothetical protein
VNLRERHTQPAFLEELQRENIVLHTKLCLVFSLVEITVPQHGTKAVAESPIMAQKQQKKPQT